MKKSPLLLMMVVTLVGASCKKSGQSSVKTLDNLAAGTFTFHACAGPDTAPIHQLGRSQLSSRPHLQRALQTIPYQVQVGFFDDLKGVIEFKDDFTPSDCPDIRRERPDELLGCWQRVPNANQSVKIILRRHPSEPNKEQYALTRILGFVYGDILMNRSIDANNQITYREVDPKLTHYKKSLAATFLGELEATTAPNDRPHVIRILTQLGIPQTVFEAPTQLERERRFQKLGADTVYGFSSRVFGEAFHSRFCTEQTFQEACQKFRNTIEQFAPYADDASGSKTQRCPANQVGLTEERASSTHLDYFGLHGGTLARRRQLHLDNGAQTNSQIARSARASNSLALLDLSSLLGMLSGGGAVQPLTTSGFMAFIKSLFGFVGPVSPTVSPQPTSFVTPTSSPTVEPSSTTFPSEPITTGATAEESAAFNDTNAFRKQEGKTPFQFDPTLLADCRRQAQAQVQGGLSHWLVPRGIATGENIGYGYPTGAAAAEGWIGSPGHRANILAGYSYMAVGAFDGGGTKQWCQRFR